MFVPGREISLFSISRGQRRLRRQRRQRQRRRRQRQRRRRRRRRQQWLRWQLNLNNNDYDDNGIENDDNNDDTNYNNQHQQRQLWHRRWQQRRRRQHGRGRNLVRKRKNGDHDLHFPRSDLKKISGSETFVLVKQNYFALPLVEFNQKPNLYKISVKFYSLLKLTNPSA